MNYKQFTKIGGIQIFVDFKRFLKFMDFVGFHDIFLPF